MPAEKDHGDKNMDDALTGDVSITGSNKDQIIAMGGEVDDDLDSFKPSAADRGDIVDGDTPPPPKKEEKPDESEEDAEEESDEAAKKSAKDDGEEEESEEKSEESDEDEPAKDDESEEDAEDEEEEPEPEPKKPAPKKGDDQRIPKQRFDEVNARRKAAEDELATLKAQQAAAAKGADKKYDFDEAEERHAQLLLDGKVKEAVAVRREINAALKAEWTAESKQTSESTVSARETKKELDTLVVEYEGLYPTLDPKSEDYSEDVVEEALSMYNGYLNTRQDLTAAQAFKLAVNNVVKIYDLKKVGGEEETPEPKTRLKEKKDVKGKIAKAKAAPKDPNKAAGDGKGDRKEDDTTTAIDQMTDEEYDALPESVRKRMRGDLV